MVQYLNGPAVVSAVFLVLLGDLRAEVLEPGDLVVVVSPTEITDDDKKPLSKLSPGFVFSVWDTENSRLKTYHHQEGWVDSHHVVPVDEAAVDRLTELLRADPQNADLYVGRGRIRYILCHCEEGLADLDEAIRLDPDHYLAHLSKAAVLKSWFFPENTQEDDWNSNSYAHGLLNALTASDANVGFNFAAGGAAFPGWVTPVALAQFGIDEEEE